MAHAPAPGTPSVSLPGTPVHSIQTVRRRIAGHHGPLTKILVANRGVRPYSSNSLLFVLSTYAYDWDFENLCARCDNKEIAVRVFRTAHELAMHTVAIYSYEDRLSAHRQKACITAFFVRWSLKGYRFK
jgi:pyruvate carboxylase